MATIPSFERLLIEVHQSLDLDSYPSKIKAQFADLGLETGNHQKKLEEMLDAIFRALHMDPLARRDSLKNLMEWSTFNKALELHTWTFNADERQVLWHLLGYSYIPSLGRRIAFWNLEGAFDEGMPGGEFWFLPHIDLATGVVQLPVPSVVKWLLDLLGLPMDEAKNKMGGANGPDYKDSIERNLYNWLAGNLPRSATINDYFQAGSELVFQGVFEIAPGLPDEEKFQKALGFVHGKNLDGEKLRGQIPMTQPGRLEAILNCEASEEDKRIFVELLLVRYAKPSVKVIRQRLLVARMVQDGYRRLLKFLCPGVQETCANPAENKLLQLIGIFSFVYNVTIDAWKNSETIEDENARFERLLPLWDKEEIFLSILPSRVESAYLELAKKLTRRFAQIQPGDALENLAVCDERSRPQLIKHKVLRLKAEYEADARHSALTARLRAGAPWRALQAEDDYWVVSQVAQDNKLPGNLQKMAITRMRELASSPRQLLGAICIELSTLLNCSTRERPADVQQTVAKLIEEARSNPTFAQWKAPLLQFEAKHCLAQNDMNAASALFRKALDACSERSFGPARGEIARDAFAAAVANQRLIPGNHEKYYRNMRDYGMFEVDLPSLEDTAKWASEYFWSDLYKPYPKVQNLRPKGALQADIYIKEAMPLIFTGNMDGLREWLKRHAKDFKKGRISDVRGDSVLLSWVKMRNFFTGNLPYLKAGIPHHLQDEIDKVEGHMKNWHQAICLLIETWPEQVNLPDFKGQTALMLAADADDKILVEALLSAGADVNTQDYKGRTPLHSAVTGRSEKCLTAILTHHPDTTKVVTDGGQTALHTAVRMADTKTIETLLAYEPSLATRANTHGQTPLALAWDILADLDRFQAFMLSERRPVASKEEFEAVIGILKAAPTIH